MYLIVKILNIIAIIVQLIGAFIMYKNSPDNTGNINPLFDDYDFVRVDEDQKNKRLKTGFLILVVGLFISLIAILLG